MRINRFRQRELITLLGGAVATSVAWPLASRAQRGDKLPTSAGVAVMPRVEADLIAAEITPRGGKEREVARALQAMDFRVHAVGATISVDAPRERWKAVFAARFATVHRRREKRRTPGAAASAQHVSPVASSVEEEETSARRSSAGLWKPADDDQLREMAALGKGPSEIARLLHRSPSAVRKRASLLGITVQLVDAKGK